VVSVETFPETNAKKAIAMDDLTEAERMFY